MNTTTEDPGATETGVVNGTGVEADPGSSTGITTDMPTGAASETSHGVATETGGDEPTWPAAQCGDTTCEQGQICVRQSEGCKLVERDDPYTDTDTDTDSEVEMCWEIVAWPPACIPIPERCLDVAVADVVACLDSAFSSSDYPYCYFVESYDDGAASCHYFLCQEGTGDAYGYC